MAIVPLGPKNQTHIYIQNACVLLQNPLTRYARYEGIKTVGQMGQMGQM